MEVRNLLEKNGGADIQIIAKIENSEGVENIDEINEGIRQGKHFGASFQDAGSYL